MIFFLPTFQVFKYQAFPTCMTVDAVKQDLCNLHDCSIDYNKIFLTTNELTRENRKRSARCRARCLTARGHQQQAGTRGRKWRWSPHTAQRTSQEVNPQAWPRMRVNPIYEIGCYGNRPLLFARTRCRQETSGCLGNAREDGNISMLCNNILQVNPYHWETSNDISISPDTDKQIKKFATITYGMIREVRNGQFGKCFLSMGGHVTAWRTTRCISTGTHWVHVVHHKVTKTSNTNMPENISSWSSYMIYLSSSHPTAKIRLAQLV